MIIKSRILKMNIGILSLYSAWVHYALFNALVFSNNLKAPIKGL